MLAAPRDERGEPCRIVPVPRHGPQVRSREAAARLRVPEDDSVGGRDARQGHGDRPLAVEEMIQRLEAPGPVRAGSLPEQVVGLVDHARADARLRQPVARDVPDVLFPDLFKEARAAGLAGDRLAGILDRGRRRDRAAERVPGLSGGPLTEARYNPDVPADQDEVSVAGCAAGREAGHLAVERIATRTSSSLRHSSAWSTASSWVPAP